MFSARVGRPSVLSRTLFAVAIRTTTNSRQGGCRISTQTASSIRPCRRVRLSRPCAIRTHNFSQWPGTLPEYSGQREPQHSRRTKTVNTDLSLMKNAHLSRISENASLQLRFEAFNVFNTQASRHPPKTPPSTDVARSTRCPPAPPDCSIQPLPHPGDSAWASSSFDESPVLSERAVRRDSAYRTFTNLSII